MRNSFLCWSVRLWCDGSSDRSLKVDPLSYFFFQPVLHDGTEVRTLLPTNPYSHSATGAGLCNFGLKGFVSTLRDATSVGTPRFVVRPLKCKPAHLAIYRHLTSGLLEVARYTAGMFDQNGTRFSVYQCLLCRAPFSQHKLLVTSGRSEVIPRVVAKRERERKNPKTMMNLEIA